VLGKKVNILKLKN